ncbi:MAG TPA: DNA polymerase I [Candidatus Scatavimonas merdigallinarum]|uniref:DNA polymerase I n=1 Tax=Candidatus Scatavimonas merdigallinarum TaxID=2840914 RepID=A0A9D0ZIU3_9FIRM|nr:DNA polymerase I [Candidatus Scatavimonas merdigallinarum]
MKLLVLDGNSILNRAFYGIKLLTTKDGRYTNAIYGFLTMFRKIAETVEPQGVAVAFDMRAPTFRHREYAGYKAQRKGMPEELAQQLPVLKRLLALLGYKIVECEGYEADDILGTLAAACEKTGNTCVIATGDRDSLQLVSDYVTVRLAATKMGRPEVTVYDRAKIKEDYGVEPAQLIDIKALQGDSSDNIPGVRGIGPKGAADLIIRFQDLDTVYQKIDTADIKDSVRRKLLEDKDNAYLSRRLGTICKTAPIDTELAHYIPAPGDHAGAVRLMAELELFSLIDKMGLRNADTMPQSTPQKQEKPWDIVYAKDLQQLLNAVIAQGVATFAVDMENGQTNALAFALDGRVEIVQNQPGFSAFLKALFENRTIKKQTHDIKPVLSALHKMDITAENAGFDTMLAAYLLNPSANSYAVSRLLEEYAVSAPRVQQEEEQRLPFAEEAAALPALIQALARKIEVNGQEKLLQEIEIPLADVLSRMENTGFMVDAQGIAQYGKSLEARLAEIQQTVYDEVGYTFNINSPKQLGEALFEKLMLPVGKKTKSGYSTSAEVLENLKNDHPAVAHVLEYRALAKLKSTYCDGLLKVIAQDERIHSSFNQTETRTGRISSTEPNLQNIPVRTQQGKEMRRFFCAKEGWLLVDADYSQIELRVLADLADDKAMIQAFQNEEDIHAITASQVFNIPLSMVTPIMRSRAKAVNFGIVYGIGAFSLSKDIGVTRKEAANYIQAYLKHYSGVDAYMRHIVEKAKSDGYVETLYGRRRYLPELASSNFNLRSFGERVARNMPIQGTAADIIKIAMIRVDRRLRKEGMRARLILQVHDELLVEAPADEAMRAAMLLQEEMEAACKLRVPLVAQAAIGRTWFDAKG